MEIVLQSGCFSLCLSELPKQQEESKIDMQTLSSEKSVETESPKPQVRKRDVWTAEIIKERGGEKGQWLLTSESSNITNISQGRDAGAGPEPTLPWGGTGAGCMSSSGPTVYEAEGSDDRKGIKGCRQFIVERKVTTAYCMYTEETADITVGAFTQVSIPVG